MKDDLYNEIFGLAKDVLEKAREIVKM